MTGNTAGTGGNSGGGAPGSGRHDGIELADAVESVRNQLIEAAARGTGRPLAFEVGDIQMEFTLELRKEVKGSARVKAWVVEAGADAGRSTGHTHKVAFTLKPRDVTTGEAWQIGNEAEGSTERFGADGGTDRLGTDRGTGRFGQGRPRP
ncbi:MULTISPECIES: trypco2 family protein [unclassified Streptomyces]|uniref:trypco2 family protein n=1 Tax=unclassified Streptomyces TaxID=2593676 RepID=UPI003802A80B